MPEILTIMVILHDYVPRFFKAVLWFLGISFAIFVMFSSPLGFLIVGGGLLGAILQADYDAKKKSSSEGKATNTTSPSETSSQTPSNPQP
ncbi:MAG: hypothetical protein J6J31_05210 [Thermoguttaceae bacterium]|nr:hypothetical protein [Thermoguttaceae bacterium]